MKAGKNFVDEETMLFTAVLISEVTLAASDTDSFFSIWEKIPRKRTLNNFFAKVLSRCKKYDKSSMIILLQMLFLFYSLSDIHLIGVPLGTENGYVFSDLSRIELLSEDYPTPPNQKPK